MIGSIYKSTTRGQGRALPIGAFMHQGAAMG